MSAEARRILDTEGESGRFEFKQTSDAVKSDVLVAAANWAALSADRDSVTLLVGVEELTDENTGLTTGRIKGLPGALAKHVELVNNRAKSTFPVPVAVTIIEENVASKKPFLRVVVRPTAAPHFDGSGRRITRAGASTRRLEDQELLDMYLDREAVQFRTRFEAIAGGLEDRLEMVAQVAGAAVEAAERMPGLIDGAEAAASMAGYEAEDTKREVELLRREVSDLHQVMLRRFNQSPAEVYRRLRHERLRVWMAFCIDRVQRPSKAADKVMTQLQTFLETPFAVDDVVRNRTELKAWRNAMKVENVPAPAAWWRRTLQDIEDTVRWETGQVRLLDPTDYIKEQIASGVDPVEIQIEPWGTGR